MKKKYLVLATLQDNPLSDEEPFGEAQIRRIVESFLSDIMEGLKFSKVKIQALPERLHSPIRGTNVVENTPERPKKAPSGTEKDLTTAEPRGENEER